MDLVCTDRILFAGQFLPDETTVSVISAMVELGCLVTLYQTVQTDKAG